ncbi:heme A synthase, partial [Myxococcus llanfairpwllgwyngyllgogerychwyrndrobwllllantysiliogogogochensis]
YETGVLVGTSVAGMLLLGVSGAVAALGDTLFPSETLMEGLRQDVSDTAHVFIRRRILHPVLAVSMGALLVLIGRWMARLRPSAEVKRAALAISILYSVQLMAGLVNVVLLAPVWLQLVHLLLADFVWMAVVSLCAAGLAADAPRAEPVVETVSTHASPV